MKEALIVIAHGSRLAEAQEEFLELINILKKRNEYEFIQEAYLEKNSPNIYEAVDILVLKKIKSIIIVPCFLFRGMHTERDIPEMEIELKKKYPEIKFRVSSPIGPDPLLAEVILKRAGNS